MVLSKGSLSQGMPHPDSVCTAGSISVWDVQLLSAQIRCRRVNSKRTGGGKWENSAEFLLSVLLHMSTTVKKLNALCFAKGRGSASGLTTD